MIEKFAILNFFKFTNDTGREKEIFCLLQGIQQFFQGN